MPQRGVPGSCTVCRHPERARIDYLIAKGGAGTYAAIGRQFHISDDSMQRHAAKHVTQEFIRAVRVGPFQNEAHLRKLCAESSTSVIDNLRAIYGGLANRWLSAFETGADATIDRLTARLHENLVIQARITRELMPPSSTVVTNVFALPDFAALQSALLRVTADHPEVRRAIVAELKVLADRREPIEVSAA